MIPSTFSDILQFLVAHGYFIFYVGAILEGVLITAAAGVASALGYFNIYIIILISVLGDLTGDLIFYSIGYYGRKKFTGKREVANKSMEKFSKLLHKNFNKAMIVVKLSPVVSVPGIILVGASHPPLKKFVLMCLAVTVPRSILFALIGFYSGAAYQHLSTTIKHAEYVISGLLLLAVVVYVLYKKFATSISENIEEEI